MAPPRRRLPLVHRHVVFNVRAHQVRVYRRGEQRGEKKRHRRVNLAGRPERRKARSFRSSRVPKRHPHRPGDPAREPRHRRRLGADEHVVFAPVSAVGRRHGDQAPSPEVLARHRRVRDGHVDTGERGDAARHRRRRRAHPGTVKVARALVRLDDGKGPERGDVDEGRLRAASVERWKVWHVRGGVDRDGDVGARAVALRLPRPEAGFIKRGHEPPARAPLVANLVRRLKVRVDAADRDAASQPPVLSIRIRRHEVPLHRGTPFAAAVALANVSAVAGST